MEAISTYLSANREAIDASVKSGRGVLLPARLAVLPIVTVLLVAFAASSTASIRYAIILGLVYAILIIGNNAITTILGEINLGMSATMAVAAYALASGLKHGWPLAFSALFATMVSTVVGACLAVPTVRLTGIFTALATFALAFAVPSLAVYLQPLTGGAEGASLPVDPVLFGHVIGGSSHAMLVLCACVFVIIGAASAMLFDMRAGRTALVVGEAPAAGAVFGIRIGMVQIATWTWAWFVGGIGGVLFALTVGYLSPTQFDPLLGIALLTGGIIGGVRSAYGALIGGLLVGTLPSQLQAVIPAAGTGIFFGAILFVALLARGRGVAEALERNVFRLALFVSGAGR